FAFLGEAAHQVLKEGEFEADRAEAGAVAAIFGIIARTDNGRINSVNLLVTEHFVDGTARTEKVAFKTADDLDVFLDALKSALEQDREHFPWDEYDLTVDAESTVQLEQGMQVAHLWRTQPAQRISLDDIYQLEGY